MSITLLSLLSSCQKEKSANQPDLSIKKVEQKVNAWLDNKSKVYNSSNENFKNELQYQEIFQKKLKDEGKFILIPLKGNFFEPTTTNKGKSFTGLQIIEDKWGNISEGNVVQYFSKDHSDKSVVPDNFFQMYSDKKPAIAGEFSFLTLTGKLLYKMKYDQYGLRSSGFVSPRKKAVTVNRVEQDPIQDYASCIDWYLVTTYIYPDGSTSQTSEYVYTTCPVSGGGGSGGGGNGNEEVYEYIVKKEEHGWSFEVYPPNSPVGGSGKTIYSKERLRGKRQANNPAGGYFTSINHVWSGLLIVDIGAWTETFNSVSASGATASSEVRGRYTLSPIDGPIQRWNGGDTKNFNFNEIFQ